MSQASENPEIPGRSWSCWTYALLGLLPFGGTIALTDLSLPTRLLAVLAVGLGFALAIKAVFKAIAEQQQIAREARDEAEMLREQARHDPLTGLANRIGFDLLLAQMAMDLLPEEKLLLLLIDLRGFKQTNEMLGHPVGDEVLRTVAKRMVQSAPEGAALGRLAGDEFMLAVPVPARGQAEAIVTQMGEAIAKPMRVDGHRIVSQACLGAALLPDDAETPDKLIVASDLALHHAKASRQGIARFFNRAMTREVARKKEMESDLRTALQRDELAIYFQPIIDLGTGRIRAFEALARWFHAEKGEIHPAQFIPVAEESGLIVALGNWVTAEAARIAAGWPAEVTLCVNLSPVQIVAPGSALGILSALNEAGLDPARLELEVTEALFAQGDQDASAFMHTLARHGVRFALDDFGTGYSSVRHLHLYPFRTLKVDRSLVSGPGSNARSDTVIRAMAEMGQTLGMNVVAEGLETIEQVRAMKAAGCTLGQGWHFSRAVPDYTAMLMLADEAERLAEGDLWNPRQLAS
ncbi:MAG: bifunctional diguanylate cyclase/phosphodiesterase [Erythrobacter sp.]|nr:MAG: bifunctional diguanylate cyclase/phosphodiesterase [Erythrobacter sp.]